MLSLRFVVAALAVFTLAACQQTNPYKDQPAFEGTIPLRAAVTDFRDVREAEQYYNSGASMIPLILWGGFMNARFDDLDQSATDPFPAKMAKDLAEELKERNAFETVEYIRPEDIPESEFDKNYDILLRGQINEFRAKGKVTRYGLSVFGDVLWEVGLPRLTRNWKIKYDLWLEDAYTGEPVTERVNSEWQTNSAVFTAYHNTRKVDDLDKRIQPAYDQGLIKLAEAAPPPSDSSWVQLYEEGVALLERKRRNQQMLIQGTPPTFSFLSPSEGTSLRQPEANVRWSIAAPNGLRAASLRVNGQPVDLGFSSAELANADRAPKNPPARDVIVPLQLGSNELSARVSDHNGNETFATLTIQRMPKTLVPERRFALLIGADAQGGAAVSALESVLTDPMIGQFPQTAVTTISGSLTMNELESEITRFGRDPLAGDFVFIYIAGEGDRTSLTVDGVPYTNLIEIIDRSIATDSVLILSDIDWNGEGGNIERELPLNRRWGFLTHNPDGGARPASGAMTAMADAAVSILQGESDSRRLTLERFTDSIITTLGGETELLGRPNPSISLAERE